MTEHIRHRHPIEIWTRGGRTLRQFSEQDARPYYEMHDKNRPHISQSYDGGQDDTGGKYKTFEEMRDSIVEPKDPSKLRFGIWDKNDLVGTINLAPRDDNTAEVGYWVDQDHLRQGITFDALQAVIDFAIDEGYEALVAEVLVGNVNSRGALEKAGFKVVRTFERQKAGVTETLWGLRLPFPENT